MPNNPFQIGAQTNQPAKPASTNPFDQANAGVVGSEAGGILSSLAPALDFLARGQYASAGFFDALLNDNAGIGQALSLAGSELLNPVKRKSFKDVISRYDPTFAANNPTTTTVLGFLGDIALDPTTYLGLGLGAATKGARIGGRALTTLGETFQNAARGALAGKELTLALPGVVGREAAEIVGRETLTKLPQGIAETARFGSAQAVPTLFNRTTTAEIAGQAAESIGKDLRTILGGKLPKGVTEQGLDDIASKISLERLGIPDTGKAVNFVTRQGDYGEILESADQLVS